jgi:galactokinase
LTSNKLTDALIEAGFGAADAESRRLLVELVTRRHGRDTGQPPDWRWFVPGRIEVFGKHTDYAGGRSLLGAVPRGFAVAASPRTDGLVCVRDARRQQHVAVDSAGPIPSTSGWLTYVTVAVRRLAINFPGAVLGVDVTITSDLPSAAGLSSSSALVIAVATAMIRRGRLEARQEWQGAIRTREHLSGYFGAMERGVAFGSLAGTTAVGTFGGSEDHTAILTCRPDVLSGYRFVPIAPIGEATMPPDWTFVIATSGIEAAKAGRARVEYNRASLAAGALVDLWRAKFGPTQMTLADLLASRSDAAEVLASLTDAADRPDFDHGVLNRRLRHFVAEDARVPDALRAFRRADREALGALSEASQDDAERLLQNQTAETGELARLARPTGAFAASSFGAGFGGSVWALASAGEAHAFGQRWTEAYRTKVRGVSGVEWFLARPGPSVLEI